MPRMPGNPDRDGSDEQTFFEQFRDNVQRHASKRGSDDVTWEDIWLTLIQTPATARVLEERGISTRELARDIEYSLHFGRPAGVEGGEVASRGELNNMYGDAVFELIKEAQTFVGQARNLQEPEYQEAAEGVLRFLQDYLERDDVAGKEHQTQKAMMLEAFVQPFMERVEEDLYNARHGGQEELLGIAQAIIESFADFVMAKSRTVTNNPLDMLSKMSGRGDDLAAYQLVDLAIKTADPFTKYALHRGGMVAPDGYKPPCKMHHSVIESTALHAFEYADHLREKNVAPKHMLGVMLEDWSIIKHLKMLEEPDIKAANEKKGEKGEKGEKPQSVFADYRTFFSKVREAIEPKKEAGERFRTQRIISPELSELIKNAEATVANGPDELASARLFGEMLKVREVRDALIAGGLTEAQLDRWPEVLGKSLEKEKKEEVEKKPKERFKVSDEELEFLLERFSRDLTKEAMLGKLDSVVGRDSETKQMIEISLQFNRSNGLLLGEAGVGKSAMFSAYAQAIASGQVPNQIMGSKVRELDIQGMNEGAMYVGMFEARLKPILEGIAERNRTKVAPPTVICMDEIAENMHVGGVSKASEIIKPILSKGGLVVFAATTQDEYQKTLRKDKAFDRRFQVIHIDPPNVQATIAILEKSQLKPMEEHYKITIPKELMGEVVRLTSRFLANKNQPDVSITLLDQACAKAKMSGHAELQLDDVMVAVAKAAHIDPDFIKHSDDRILLLEEKLQQRVLGQKDAINKIANSIVTANAGLNDPDKPLGAFLLLGPTGVGKTETARAIAEEMHGSKSAMIRIDMGKYKESHSLSGLIGSPPGYVGHGEEGELTGAVRKKPYSVIVLDEIEKAHPDIFKLLLSILEEGEIVDANNERINFRNTVILMTSNLRDPKKYFPPEMINRMSGVLDYNPLAREQIRSLVDREVAKVSERMEVQWGLTITLTDKAKDQLSEHGFNSEYGARALIRAIAEKISAPLSLWLLSNKSSLPNKGVIEIEVDDLGNFKPHIKDNVIPFVPPAASPHAKILSIGSSSALHQESIRVDDDALVINLNGSSVRIVGINGEAPQKLLELLGVTAEDAEKIKTGELPAQLKIGVSHGKQ